jgi:hypothetical protein
MARGHRTLLGGRHSIGGPLPPGVGASGVVLPAVCIVRASMTNVGHRSVYDLTALCFSQACSC